MALQEIGFVRIKTLPPRPPCTNPPKPAQPYENRHRSRHHQLRPCLHRRTRSRRSRLPAHPHLRNAATGRARPHRAAPHLAFFPLPRRRPARRRLRARAGRAGAHQAGALRQVLALQSRCGPHRQDPPLGFARNRPRALPRGSLSALIAAFRDAWDTAWGNAKQLPLADQDIVLTVPASFDEEARELTVMAAEQAGLPKLTLLEETAPCAGI